MVNLTGFSAGNRVKLEAAPATGSSTGLASPYNWLVFTNPGTIAAQTVVLPTTGVDGQELFISNYAQITSLTFSPAVTGWTNTSQLNAGQGIWVAYSTNTGVWFVNKL